MSKHTPGPWTWRDAAGAGIQISGTLPAGFKFDHTNFGADGNTEFMLFTLREPQSICIADARWVQFETAPWTAMQESNARLIAAAPDLLAACRVVLQGLELSGAYGTHWAVTLRAAIAKAEGGAA